MGCGGIFDDLFILFDRCGYSRRGCGGNRNSHNVYYQQDDTEEKLILIKRMYAEDLINEDEFQGLKQRIYDRHISFEELIDIKRNRTNGDNWKAAPVRAKPFSKE